MNYPWRFTSLTGKIDRRYIGAYPVAGYMGCLWGKLVGYHDKAPTWGNPLCRKCPSRPNCCPLKGLLTESWNLDFRMAPNTPRTDPRGSQCLSGLYKQCGLCWTLLSFWDSGTLVYARQKIPIWPAASRNPELWVSDELPRLAYFTQQVVTTHCWEMKPILCDSGKEPWKLTPGIPYTWLHGPFPLPVVLSMTLL